METGVWERCGGEVKIKAMRERGVGDRYVDRYVRKRHGELQCLSLRHLPANDLWRVVENRYRKGGAHPTAPPFEPSYP